MTHPTPDPLDDLVAAAIWAAMTAEQRAAFAASCIATARQWQAAVTDAADVLAPAVRAALAAAADRGGEGE